jgi:hypothetical protein
MHPLKLKERPLVADDIASFYEVWGDILRDKGHPEAAVFLKDLHDDFRCRLDELLLQELQDQDIHSPWLEAERTRFALSEEGIEHSKGLIRYYVNTALDREEKARLLHQLQNPPLEGAN